MKHILHTLALSALILAITPSAADAAERQSRKKHASAGTSNVKKSVPQRAAKSVSFRRNAEVKRRPAVAAVPPRPSFGMLAGLHNVQDDLSLRSSVALVIDEDTDEILVRKNDSAVLPIASLTKLMTGLIISESRLPLDELVTITDDDVDTEKGSSSRLKVGTTLTRGELMHLALMSSENRAAHALGRTFPGGMSAFVNAMNNKARQLGMKDSSYVEPTGLSSRNQSSARDLATLVKVASSDALLREFSTSTGHVIEVGSKSLRYNNTNRLVHRSDWDIGLQKTGYISEAGQCLVMQVKLSGRKLIMVFLDSAGKLSRIADAERVRQWLEAHGGKLPAATGGLLVRQVSN